MAEDLWTFSNRIYRAEGVAAACINLQDRHGLDVNMLLFCCWTGMELGAVPEAALAEADAISAPWSDNVVGPIRHARRWLKANRGESPLREQIRSIELDAERREQHELEAYANTIEGVGYGADAVRSNVETWLTTIGAELDDLDRRMLQTVLDAASA